MTELTTERLRLRAWRDSDLPAFAALGADPCVMEFMPKRLTWAESKARAAHIRDHHLEPGHRHWVVEAPGVASFVGLLNLGTPPFEAAFTPCVEIGWRLAAEYWGRGYATGAARRVLAYGFDTCDLSRDRRVHDSAEPVASETAATLRSSGNPSGSRRRRSPGRRPCGAACRKAGFNDLARCDLAVRPVGDHRLHRLAR